MGGAFCCCVVDLILVECGASYLLEPRSILGMLWLQTHFEPDSWDLICAGKVRLSATTRESLCCDATAAGLRISCLAAPRQLSS